jgi:hypothetical protein
MHVTICVQKFFHYGVSLLECWDSQVWKNHVQNYAQCHFPHVNVQVDPSLAIVPTSLQCVLCE